MADVGNNVTWGGEILFRFGCIQFDVPIEDPRRDLKEGTFCRYYT